MNIAFSSLKCGFKFLELLSSMNVVKKSRNTEKWRSFHSDCSRIRQYYDALLSGKVCNYLFMIYPTELSALQFIQRRVAND
jgi:hypothetical protein